MPRVSNSKTQNMCQTTILHSNVHLPIQTCERRFSLSYCDLADKKRTPLKKPVTPKGKFDLEDEAQRVELDKIREELRLKEEAEKEKDEEEEAEADNAAMGELVNEMTGERGGPKGQEPTEYGDWQRKGRVSDF